MADLPKGQSLDDLLRWLDRLEKAAGAPTALANRQDEILVA